MITFQREKFRGKLYKEIKPFFPIHYKELAVDQDDVPLDPDYDSYFKLEDQDILHMFVARDDGVLIGYIVTFIKGHIHYRSTPTGHNDIYYLNKAYRHNGIGRDFFKAWMVELKRLGVIRVLLGTKLHEDHSKLFQHLGFKVADTILTKVL